MGAYVPRLIPAAHAATVADGGGTETVVLTSAAVDAPGQGATVTVAGVVNLTTASAGTTAVVLKVRRGSTTGGTQVGTSITITATTSANYCIPFAVTDTPGDIASMTYVVTITETGASSNLGSMVYGYIDGTIS